MTVPFERISLKMLFRGLYHFTQAANKGKAVNPIAYFAVPENQYLDIVKRLQGPILRLNIDPYPI
jgi:hypothetical protein